MIESAAELSKDIEDFQVEIETYEPELPHKFELDEFCCFLNLVFAAWIILPLVFKSIVFIVRLIFSTLRGTMLGILWIGRALHRSVRILFVLIMRLPVFVLGLFEFLKEIINLIARFIQYIAASRIKFEGDKEDLKDDSHERIDDLRQDNNQMEKDFVRIEHEDLRDSCANPDNNEDGEVVLVEREDIKDFAANTYNSEDEDGVLVEAHENEDAVLIEREDLKDFCTDPHDDVDQNGFLVEQDYLKGSGANSESNGVQRGNNEEQDSVLVDRDDIKDCGANLDYIEDGVLVEREDLNDFGSKDDSNEDFDCVFIEHEDLKESSQNSLSSKMNSSNIENVVATPSSNMNGAYKRSDSLKENLEQNSNGDYQCRDKIAQRKIQKHTTQASRDRFKSDLKCFPATCRVKKIQKVRVYQSNFQVSYKFSGYKLHMFSAISKEIRMQRDVNSVRQTRNGIIVSYSSLEAAQSAIQLMRIKAGDFILRVSTVEIRETARLDSIIEEDEEEV
jgi:hypothetical protein